TVFASSLAMYQRAEGAIVGGIAHDGRYQKPFPLYVSRADGAYKFDLDGKRIIDYAMGHGALILGHGDPDVRAAVHAQLDRGTHYGAGHEGEVIWAELVTQLVPSADRVRFVGSGTEATLLAMRLARTYTGKSSILKFEGHFHGWNDYLVKGEKPPFENAGVAGVPDDVLRTVAVVPSNDVAMLQERLALEDVSAVIIEPSGGSWCEIPLQSGFLQKVRELFGQSGSVLIFDEVITGFRWAPGGAQERFGIIPDLTTMAKIVAGGLPGGAVAGRGDIMANLAFTSDPNVARKKIGHPGTFNANPMSAAAAGVALRKCADKAAVQDYCDAMASALRTGMNSVLERRGQGGCVWGDSSAFHVILDHTPTNRTAADLQIPQGIPAEVLKASAKAGLAGPLSVAMELEGVDLFGGGGLLSVRHTPEDIEFTITAFDRALDRLTSDGYFS
ncbi:MAG TPA: aspartate aminotransferase family protein, partial [Thermomicrobiales bacterium]|nr:aspartate aminotransferase family protein [Thermomicrobiales bacterium]